MIIEQNIPSSDVAESILQIVSEFEGMETDVFIRKKELGEEWCFTELEKEFNELKIYIKKFNTETLSNIPETQLSTIKQNIESLYKSLQDIKSFSSKPKAVSVEPNLPANYSEILKIKIVSNFKKELSSFYSVTQPIITFGISARLENLEAFYLRKANTATKEEIKSRAIRFDKQANTHKTNANWWLAISVAVAIALILFILCGFSDKESIVQLFKDNSTQNNSVFIAELVRLLIIRILIISVMSFILAFCIKNYNALRHNSIVKTHKSNCLNVFYDFEPILTNPIAKQEILLSATKAIFEKSRSGYDGKDAEISSPNIMSTIIEKAAK